MIVPAVAAPESARQAEELYHGDQRARAMLDLVLESRYIPWSPTPKQALALMSDKPEQLYGGAIGGGKSIMLLMAALQFMECDPKQHGGPHASLLMRRDLKMLKMAKALIPLSHEALSGTDAKWNSVENEWRWPCGHLLKFGYMRTPYDYERYQGSAWHTVGYDELTQFDEQQFTYLITRQRRDVDTTYPIRIRATSNPGGRGHLWCKRRFLDSSDDEREYIPALMTENPYLDTRSYLRRLRKNLPQHMVEALVKGEWDARPPGELFNEQWWKHADRRQRVKGGSRPIRFWDLAATAAGEGRDPDYTVGLLLWRDPWGMVWVEDMKRGQWDVGRVKREILRCAERDGHETMVRMGVDPGQAGKDQVADYQLNVLAGYDFQGVPINGSKWIRAQPIARQAEAGNVTLVAGEWVEDFIDETTAFAEDERSYAHDDIVDALSGGYNQLVETPTGGRRPYWQDGDDEDEERASVPRQLLRTNQLPRGPRGGGRGLYG